MSETLVRKCRAAEIFDDPACAALLDEYAEECAIPEFGTPCPHRHLYATMEATGMMQCFGVYVGPDLVGFANVLTSPVPHFSQKAASLESLFLSKAHRGHSAGAALFAALEDHARREGCKGIFYSARVGTRLATLLFLSSDLYMNTNHVFYRRLA